MLCEAAQSVATQALALLCLLLLFRCSIVAVQHVPRGTMGHGSGREGDTGQAKRQGRGRPTAKAEQVQGVQWMQCKGVSPVIALEFPTVQGGERRRMGGNSGRSSPLKAGAARAFYVERWQAKQVQGCRIRARAFPCIAWKGWTDRGGGWSERAGRRLWDAVLPIIRHNERRWSALNGGASRLNAGGCSAGRAGVPNYLQS